MEVGDTSNKILLAVSDLFFAARIRNTAAQLGLEALPIGASEKVSKAVGRELPRLLIVDLDDARFDAIRSIEEIKTTLSTRSIRILGFLSHVQTELREAAVRAGCDRVLPRSTFTQSLAQILKTETEERSLSSDA